MHPTEPIAAPIESLAWIVGRWATGELVAYFESEASPHSPDDEFRYAQR